MMIWMNWEQVQDELREKIKAQRGAAAAIAKRLDVSRAAVSEYVAGKRDIPGGHITTILEVLRLEMTLNGKKDS